MFQNSILHNVSAILVLLALHSPVYADSSSRIDGKGDKNDSAIVDLSAPPGLTESQKQEWRDTQGKIWEEAQGRYAYIEAGDLHFKSGRYKEALRQYKKAYETARLRFERIQPAEKIVLANEALGDFARAIESIDDLLSFMGEAPAKSDVLFWRSALEAAGQNHFDETLRYLRSRLATAKDSEKRWLFLEQRLRLMEDRARAAGQLLTENR